MNDFFTWEILVTYAGACLATGIITEFVDKLFPKVPTQVVGYCVALIILILGNFFTGSLTVSSGVLCLFNAILVCGATSGTISGVKRITMGKDETK